MAITFGSLFAGIGGMDLGLERAGMKCQWQVEINPYAQKILAKHWPTVARHADVRKVGGGNLSSVDVICGGFPCQDISNAGTREGIGGARSGLWGEYARIIRELRPRGVLVENVAALLVRGLGRVLGDLAALGYDAEWDCLQASTVGAPHRRDRLFLFAYPHSLRMPRLFARGDSGADGQWRTRRAPAVRHWVEGWSHRPFVGGGPASMLCRVADGVPDRVVRVAGLGNAVVPQVAEWIGRRVISFLEQR